MQSIRTRGTLVDFSFSFFVNKLATGIDFPVATPSPCLACRQPKNTNSMLDCAFVVGKNHIKYVKKTEST